MALSPEISKALEMIDQRIAQLQKARAALVDAFGSAAAESVAEVTRTPQNGSGKGRPDRFRQLVKYLKTHGPARRKQILAHSGIPEGTVGYLLSTYKNFKQLPDGRWATEKQAEQFATTEAAAKAGGQTDKSA